MAYKPGERDLVMLQHKFYVEWADGKTVRFSSFASVFCGTEISTARRTS
jgi:hypothetical protein